MRAVVLALLFGLMLPLSARALPATQTMLEERSLGNPSAPVTMIEYSSFTCPHCADFHRETMPELKSAYIDTGKVRYVFREFPLDRRALAASMVARCVAPDRFFGLVDMLYRDQQTWARSANPLDDLKIRAQLAGLSPADFDACLNNQDLANGIQARAAEAREKDKVESTPTFFVNGRLISGAVPFAEFQAAIDEALAKATAK